MAFSRAKRDAANMHIRSLESWDHKRGLVPPHDLTDKERIQRIISTFDKNGDDALDFKESNELQEEAWGGSMTKSEYTVLCQSYFCTPAVGMGEAALTTLYEEDPSLLDRDYDAAGRAREPRHSGKTGEYWADQAFRLGEHRLQKQECVREKRR